MKNGVFCPNCNTPNPYTSAFCSRCGQNLPSIPTSAPPYRSSPIQPVVKSKTQMSGCMVGSLGCLGIVVVLAVIGMISSTYEGQKKAATDVAQQAKLDAYHKTPAYRAQAMVANKKRRAESARKSQALRDAKAQEAKAQNTEINIIKENANSVEKLLRKANGTTDGELFSGYSVDNGDKLTLTTTPVFDAVPYRSRLQITTLLYGHWNALCNRTSSHKVALFHMKDIAGNEVGGANVLSGAWVVEQ